MKLYKNIGTLHSLMMEYFCRTNSVLYLYCVYVCDVVYLVGTINKYTASKCTERTVLKFLYVYFTIQSPSLSLHNKNPQLMHFKNRSNLLWQSSVT